MSPEFDHLRRAWAEERGLDAAWDLAIGLESSGRIDDARRVYREIIDEGYPIGYLGLAWIEHDREEHGAAEALLERYFDELDPGDADSLETKLVRGVLGHWRWHIHGRVDAEPLLRQGQSEYESARADLASLLMSTGRPTEAREVLESWVEFGDTGCCIRLGNLHQEAGEYDEAERFYLLGYQRGDAHSARNLALMLHFEQDRREEAIEWMRRAVEGGDVLAIRDLAEWEERPDSKR